MRVSLIVGTFLLFSSLSLWAQDTTKVLFIGNSITYFNDMPQTFEAIANSKGDYTEVTVYAPGGTGFIHHVNDQNVYNFFRERVWDYVILQPGSNESPGYSEPISATLTRARTLQDTILFYNPCAKILYYEISYGVWGNTSNDLNTYNNTMDLIRANIEFLADSTESFFAPAGETMRTAWNTNPSIMLWGGYGDIHPNAIGSYMIACTFYCSIFQRSSFGSNITNSLSTSEASYYQLLADSIVLNHLINWRINTFDLKTNFEYTIDQSFVTFYSTSQNVDSLIWDFGDGNISKSTSASNTYDQNGTYLVTLTAYKNGCIDTLTKAIDINSQGLNMSSSLSKVNLYPNPFTDKIFIENLKDKEISLSNLLGQDFIYSVSIIQTLNGIEVNTATLPKGVYVLKTKSYAKIIFKQ